MASFVELRGSGLPHKDPNARCDACGCLGTVARALRLREGAEIHHFRFCAACWVEESARLRARWDEEDALAQDAAFRTHTIGEMPSMGSAFESAIWHGARDFLLTHIYPSMRSATPPTEASLRDLADRYRAKAPDMVGPMPFFVEIFIAKYASPTDTDASSLP